MGIGYADAYVCSNTTIDCTLMLFAPYCDNIFEDIYISWIMLWLRFQPGMP